MLITCTNRFNIQWLWFSEATKYEMGGHVERMEKIRNVYTILVRKSEELRPIGKPS